MKRATLKRYLMLLLIAVCALLRPLAAVAEGVPTQKYILDNGLTVLISPMPDSPVVTVYALVKTGSATEGKYTGMGISHFVEHMLFKGTAKRAVGKIPEEVMAEGGLINASTSFDYTIYTVDLPAGAFDKGLDIISDMIMNSKFDPEETEKERKVIVGEMRLYNDNPDRRLSELVFDNAYIRHPYKYPIIGYESLFEKISRDDLWEYYQSKYIPNNIVLSVTGRVDAAEALPKIKAVFKDWARQPAVLRNLPEEPAQIAGRKAEAEYPTELTRVSLAFGGVSVLSRDMFALDVLAMIMGQGASSRLYLEVYKKQELVHSISASDYTPLDKGLFEVTMLLDEDKVDAAIKAVWEQINLIKTKGVDPRELEKVKRQAVSQDISGRQTAGDVAYDLVINESSTGDPDFSEKYVAALKALKVEDIKRVANQYLTGQNLTTVILRPQSDTAQGEAQKKTPVPVEIKKTVLDNGITVLLREDHTFPLVDITLALKGGIRRETAATNGVSELMANLWTKGTKSRSADEIAKSVESLGAGAGGFSGRNSMGLNLSSLSEDIDFLLALLEDLVKNPVFDEKEFLQQKEQMKAAITAREDNISSVTGRALRETLFLTHPSRLDSLGTIESVDRLTRQQVIDYYKKYCVANNMVLTVTGDFNSENVLRTLRAKFSSLPKGDLPPELADEDTPKETREKTLHMDKEQAMVMIGFQGTTVSGPDRRSLEIVSSILGSSFSGRIFTKIRDQLGKAYTLGGSFTPGLDPGLAYFFVLTTDDQVDKVKELLVEEIKLIQAELVGEEELNRMKTYLKGTFSMGLETNSAVGFMATLDELYGLGFDRYKSFDQSIDRVTREDIRRVAQKYLDVKKAAIVITRPETNGTVKKSAQSERPRPPDMGTIGSVH